MLIKPSTVVKATLTTGKMAFQGLNWLFGLGKSDLYGSAEWIKGFELKRLLSKSNDGLVIDGINRISKELSFKHLYIEAPTGTGKTTRYILNNVLNLQGESCVITDPSGEICAKSKNYLESIGYTVKVLNFSDVENSLKFNPLYRANSHTEIAKISSILVDSAFPSKNTDSFWNDSAKSLISIVIRSLRNNPNQKNLPTVYRLLQMFGTDQQEALDTFMSESLDSVSYEEYLSFVSQEDKLVSNIISTCKTALYKMSDPELVSIFESENLFFETLRSEKTAIFLIVREDEVAYYGFALTLLYSQMFKFAMNPEISGSPYLPIYFMLDEFGNTSKLPNMASIITTIRKKKCSISLVLQNKQQVFNIYGREEGAVILDSCVSKLYYSGLSEEACKSLENVLGKRTLNHKEMGFSRDGDIPNRDTEMGRSLMFSNEIRTMDDNQAIFISANKKPALLKTKAFYEIPELLRRSRLS